MSDATAYVIGCVMLALVLALMVGAIFISATDPIVGL